MGIFKNKPNVYKVYCDLDQNKKVRQFAEEHAAMGTVVETRAHGSLLDRNVRVTVTFKSYDHEPQIYRAFLDIFKNREVKIQGKSLSVLREVGLT